MPAMIFIMDASMFRWWWYSAYYLQKIGGSWRRRRAPSSVVVLVQHTISIKLNTAPKVVGVFSAWTLLVTWTRNRWRSGTNWEKVHLHAAKSSAGFVSITWWPIHFSNPRVGYTSRLFEYWSSSPHSKKLRSGLALTQSSLCSSMANFRHKSEFG